MSTRVPNFEISLGTQLALGATGPEFAVFTKDPFSGMPLQLTGLLRIAGTFGGATVALQMFIGGLWVDHPQISAIATALIRELVKETTGNTSTFVATGPSGTKFRFQVTGGDGTTALDITLNPSYAEVRLIS